MPEPMEDGLDTAVYAERAAQLNRAARDLEGVASVPVLDPNPAEIQHDHPDYVEPAAGAVPAWIEGEA